MSLKITYKGNTHLFKGKSEVAEIQTYIKQIYPELALLPIKFTYLDEENDEITVSCNEDLSALFETKKVPKLIVSLPNVLPALKLVQSVKIDKEQNSKIQEEMLKEQELKKQQLLEEQREKAKKEREERRKQAEDQRKQKIEEFFQKCKTNKHLSKKMTHLQSQIKQKMPEIEKFLQRDLAYEGSDKSSSDNSSDEEEQKDDFNFNQDFLHWGQKLKGLFGGQHQGLFRGMGSCQGFKRSAQNKTQEGKTIHRGYSCDGCRQYPIIGFRYECTECPDFDYCETCYENKDHEHKQESFKKVEENVLPHRFLKKQQFQHQQRKVEERKKQREEKQKEEKKEVEQEAKKEEPQVELRVKKLAEEVSQILGSKEEAYYKVCELYKNESVNFIIDQIFHYPEQYEYMK